MDKQPQTIEAQLLSTLRAIKAQLDTLEKAIAQPKPPHQLRPSPRRDALILWMTRENLSKLTIKRHAVLTATLGGLGYREIADLMGCSVTTVKLHLKSALKVLGIKDRSILLAVHSDLLGHLSEAHYLRRFGLRKTWWKNPSPSLLTVLKASKPANNQYTRHTGD